MDHFYEEIKNKHHQRYRLSAAVISSIVFTYLVTVFLLLTNSLIKNTGENKESLTASQFTAKNNMKQPFSRN